MRGTWALGFVVTTLAAGCAEAPPTFDAAAVDVPAAACASDEACDDGRFCNGIEHCRPESVSADDRGCEPGTPPCERGTACDESIDACTTECRDADGDGALDRACGGDDCDDGDPERHPAGIEVCDGVDQDCDPLTLGAIDADRDGHPSALCCNPDATGGARCGDDCDDARAWIGPEAAELCDDLDNDCDGAIDESTTPVPWYLDGDRDGFGDPLSDVVPSCAPIAGRVTNADDCDDRDGRRNPGAPEVCDGIDNDCNEAVDDGAEPVSWYVDADGDGFGDPSSAPVSSCRPLPGRSIVASDCDDRIPGRNPAAPEVCDGIDNDCDARADEGVGLTYYRDLDGDLYGVNDDSRVLCAAAGAYRAAVGGDCDDSIAYVHPSARETCNSIDDDCDGDVDDGCPLTSTPGSLAFTPAWTGWYAPSASGVDGGTVTRAAACPAGSAAIGFDGGWGSTSGSFVERLELVCVPVALEGPTGGGYALVWAGTPVSAGGWMRSAGDTPFSVRCPEGTFLTGYQASCGSELDAIRAHCASFDLASWEDGTQRWIATAFVSTPFGGVGENAAQEDYRCPTATPFVVGAVINGIAWPKEVSGTCAAATATIR